MTIFRPKVFHIAYIIFGMNKLDLRTGCMALNGWMIINMRMREIKLRFKASHDMLNSCRFFRMISFALMSKHERIIDKSCFFEIHSKRIKYVYSDGIMMINQKIILPFTKSELICTIRKNPLSLSQPMIPMTCKFSSINIKDSEPMPFSL